MDSLLVPDDGGDVKRTLLYDALESAASSDPARVRRGTKQLQEWETEQGYYVFLQAVFIDKSLPFEIRYLSIIQLKNGIDRYWRKTATHAVSKEDKIAIRSRLLHSGVNEENERLALQNAIVVAKIVRFDFPTDWPTVVEELLVLLQTSTSLHLARTLLMLLHVAKELVTGRLPRTKAVVQHITPKLVHALGNIYLDRVQRWQAAQNTDVSAYLDQSLLAIKSLRRLIVSGYEFPNRNDEVCALWIILKKQLGTFLDLSSSGSSNSSYVTKLNKHLIQHSKLHLDVARVHPAAFVYLPESVDLVRSYWSVVARFSHIYGGAYPSYQALAAASRIQTDGDAADEDTSVTERLSLQGLKLIRACVKMVYSPAQTFKYRTALDKEEKAEAIQTIRTKLLSDDFVREVVDVIVSRYFVFRPSDLRRWEDEPEEWEKQEDNEGEDYEFSIRPCSEKLFLDLTINYKHLVVDPLLNFVAKVKEPSFDNVLSKDSAYTAIGLAAPVLHDRLNFDEFLTSTLTTDVQSRQPGCQLLRRRIAILIGQWISVKVSKVNRPVVYEIFRQLLNKEDTCNDQVVRVTAGRQLYKVADEWEFEAQQFMQYAPDTLTRLMKLIEEVELTDTKLALLNTVSVLVERFDYYITPYADRIVALLPPLWEQSGSEHLMKQAVLTILGRLIKAMRSESRPLHSLVLPIVKGAIEPGSETQVYLLDDALDLWSNILSQTPAPVTSELLSLVPYLLPLFELGTETLRKALDIAESYIVLAPSDMLSDQIRGRMLTRFTALLGSKAVDGLVTKLAEMLIRFADNLAGEEGLRVIVTSLMETGFLNKMLDDIKGNWESHQTTGPNGKDPVLDSNVETDYLAVLARIALANPGVFIESLQAYGSDSVSTEDVNQTIKWLLQEWFDNFSDINDPARSKLMCLALTKLLETRQPWMLAKLQDLFNIWAGTVQELDAMEDHSKDCLVYWETEDLRQPAEPEPPEDARRRHLTYSDPVHKLYIVPFIKQHFHEAVVRAGGEQIFAEQWLVNVDKDAIDLVRRCGIF